jgi:hypothetical protein
MLGGKELKNLGDRNQAHNRITGTQTREITLEEK